jgi:hypothetical protein
MSLIPTPYRILALVLLALACAGFGYVQGVSRESDRRDAIALQQERADHQAFAALLANGKRHAANVLAWQRKAQTYYLNWQRNLDETHDSQLAQCQTPDGTGAQPGGVPAALLSGTWVGLYNAAWRPELGAASDTGGAAAKVTAAGAAATPREALDNIAINARLCGDDRKRLDELIDHLVETGAH